MPNVNETLARTARVVVGVDQSHNAAVAADWAAGVALARDEMLTLVAAIDLPTTAGSPHEPTAAIGAWHSQGRAVLSETSARLAAKYPKLRIETDLSDREPVDILTELSKDADLVVTGTRGHGGFTGMLLGSVSHRVAAHAHCPLVVVPEEQGAEVRREVVLGLDRDEDPAPIDFAFETAARLALSVRAVRAFAPIELHPGLEVGDVDSGRREAVAAMENLLHQARERYPDVPVSFEAESGNSAAVLLAVGRGARLVVVGARRHQRHLWIRPGYTVLGLLSRSEVPVAVVPIQ